MISIGEFLAVIFITLLLSSIFYYGLRKRGPWGSFWSFILVLFLGLLLMDAWLTPIGPVWWDVAWIDLALFGIFIALLLGAATPATGKKELLDDTSEMAPSEVPAYAAGLFFWILIVFLVVVLIARLLV